MALARPGLSCALCWPEEALTGATQPAQPDEDWKLGASKSHCLCKASLLQHPACTHRYKYVQGGHAGEGSTHH